MSDDRSQTTVAVPRWALEFVMLHGDFCDRGPRDQGWPSEEMERALRAIEGAMENHV